MDNLYKRKVYESMRKKKAAASKRREQIGLSNRLLDDSDEESCASTTSISESEYENEDSNSSGTERTPDSVDEKSSSDGDGSESSSKHTESQSRRKRPSFPDSSSDSDSDEEPKPKKKKGPTPRKRIIFSRTASDSDAEKSTSKEQRVAEAKETIAKRKQRKNKLLALSKKMKSRVADRRNRRKNSGEEDDDKEEAEADVGSDKAGNDDGGGGGDDGGEDSVDDGRTAIPSSQEEIKTSDSLNDFIAEDEEKGDEDELEHRALSLPPQFIAGSQVTHFQTVVKALLINVLDKTFLKSLYSGERTKRYAQEMKMSLFHFDERTVLPRLENLKTRSRWTERYKARVECYPKVRLLNVGVNKSMCEACDLQRQSSFTVKLWGQLYDNNTLQEDHFMPNDSQTFSVGSVCANRTEVYHLLKHFKYHLFQHCRTVLEEEKKSGTEEEAVKDTVNRVFIKLHDGGWISEQFEKFQDHLNKADVFQEEKLD